MGKFLMVMVKVEILIIFNLINDCPSTIKVFVPALVLFISNTTTDKLSQEMLIIIWLSIIRCLTARICIKNIAHCNERI